MRSSQFEDLFLLRLSAVISSALMSRGGYLKVKDLTQTLEVQFQAGNFIHFSNAHTVHDFGSIIA